MSDRKPITEAQLVRQAAFVARHAIDWASDLMMLLHGDEHPADPDTVRRFLADIQGRLDLIRDWNKPACQSDVEQIREPNQ